MKLALIVGHEALRPGVYGVAPISQFEYFFNSRIAERIIRRAEVHRIKTKLFYRDGSTIRKVGKAVNDWAMFQNACAIELHFNSFNRKVSGTETLIDDEPKENRRLAELVHGKVLKVLKRGTLGDRGIKLLTKKDRGHTSLKSVKIPSCLIEPAFCDNPKEAQLLWEKRQEYLEALTEAAFEFLRGDK